MHLFTEGMLIDLGSAYIDLDQPWYDHNCRDSRQLPKVFVMTGDLVIMDKDATWSTCVQQEFRDHPEPAGSVCPVNEGKWTMDLMYSAWPMLGRH